MKRLWLYWKAYKEIKQFVVLVKKKGSLCWNVLYLKVLAFIEELENDKQIGSVIEECLKEGKEAFEAGKKVIELWK